MHNKRVLFEQFFHFIRTFEFQDLIDMWEIRDFYNHSDISSLKYRLKKLEPLLSLTNSYIIIIDMATAKMLYISPNIKRVIGYTVDEYTIPLLMKIFCMADAKTNTQFVKKINQHQRTNKKDNWQYQYVTNYRVFHKEQYFIWLENRIIFLGYNHENKPTITFSIATKIEHFKSNDFLSYTRLKLDISSKKYELDEYIELPPEGIELFDKTGLAIVKGLINGQDNFVIAKNLGISVHTLHEYRKKMLKKTWCENTSELVSFALRNNLIK